MESCWVIITLILTVGTLRHCMHENEERVFVSPLPAFYYEIELELTWILKVHMHIDTHIHIKGS